MKLESKLDSCCIRASLEAAPVGLVALDDFLWHVAEGAVGGGEDRLVGEVVLAEVLLGQLQQLVELFQAGVDQGFLDGPWLREYIIV